MSLESIINILVLVGLAVLGFLHKLAADTRKEILETLKELAAKVGIQNGRVGRLEEWKTEHSRWKEEALDHIIKRVDRIEDSEREELKRDADESASGRPRRRK